MPAKFSDFVFCYEWGISYTDYQNNPDEVNGVLNEIMAAKSEGMDRKIKKEKAEIDLKTAKAKLNKK